MVPSVTVLKDSRKRNIPQDSGAANACTSKVKHSLPSNPTFGSIDRAALCGTDSLSVAKNPMDRNAVTEPPVKPPAISPSYFTSAIRTLKASTSHPAQECISIHDLVEAYNTLSNKIRMEINFITSDEPPLFLAIFKEESSHIVGCLARDIRRVLPNSFDSQPQPHSFADLSYFSETAPNEDDLRTIRENNTLCQYALRFVSDIFTFPALYSNFTDNQLTCLLRDVASLCATTTPPTLGLTKSSAIALWTLKVQQLPMSILAPLKVEVIWALRNSISHQVGGYMGKLDAFKAIHCILETRPKLSVSFIELLPLVLDNLDSGSPEVQLHASLALSAFTSAKLNPASKDQFPQEPASKFVQTFVETQSQKKCPGPENSLLSSFKAALADVPQWRRLGPSFALATTSCFLVLLDHFFFTNSRSVKFVVAILQEFGRHKQGTVRDTQPEIWKILFWAFSRVPMSLDRVNTSGKPSVRERAYRLVCEDLRGGRNLNLLGSLLGADNSAVERDRSEPDVTRAIDLIIKFVETGDSTSRNEGVATLSRLTAGIGAPSTARDVDGDQALFSQNLIDGTLLSQTTREISVLAVKKSVEQLLPLSEKEVIRHWDKLSKLWLMVAQRDLLSSQDFPPRLFQVWQALLLVHGNLAPGEQHLSASSSFAHKVASIVNTLSIPLDTFEMHRRYLALIGKLWAVMRNVFTTTWLSSPAEMILASLLQKQFTLSDEHVRELWSQLCGDLISVGIPTLLHVLHRRSESQEEAEVTRQLWLVLAEHGPLVKVDENWGDLLQFLVMPFGVWEISSSELETWISIFKRALDGGIKASRTPNDVISQFFSFFKVEKLASLKQSSRILHWLLLQSTTPPYFQPNDELIGLIDENIFSAYSATVEKKAYALDTLRLIGKLISTMEGQEVVQLLSLLQKSLSCWIADERKELDDHEDKELVDILYKPSLELLAKIEPSMNILKSVAKFIQSVFVRIRGEGPLAFHKFWHATYHIRPDIPKSDYPPLIQQCLKAWADITDGSLAEGISLDSGSESLRSYTIPDSQPFEETISGDVDQNFDISFAHDDQPIYVVAHNYAESSNSDGAVTPIGKSRSTRLSARDTTPATPLAAPHSCASNYDSGSPGSIHESDDGSLKFHGISASRPKKRSAGSELPRPPKKSRTNKHLYSKSQVGKEKTEKLDLSVSSNRPSGLTTSVSEPVTRAPSQAAFLPRSTSQPFQDSPSRDANETPSWLGSDLRKLQLPSARHQPPVTGKVGNKLSSDDDDYDSWEQGVSAEDLKYVQAELQDSSDYIIPDSEENPGIDADNPDQGQLTEQYNSEDQDLLSPSLGEYPLRTRPRNRSQTAPEPSTFASRELSRAQPLRRNQTSPLEHKRSSSAQLDALQRAYAVVADTGTSQIDVQDIMHARRLANQINQALDEQMCLKFGASKEPRAS
ncbi:hypothetical protein GALMADRAFT_237661 [Galerina marginata CBS 339.88]|uniref:Telomere-associated protein Rif1 N-terminal domain-containing protein n=1 Tax=Galerina marginata (strain CBS 339.88) TaxID=685588 RepID=A0A067TR43_GALM3|nr:hypothetical protein GALMADRAFT_237661 [Galerina marginata CBS 339.88]